VAACGTQDIVFGREPSLWLASGADTFEAAQSLGELYLTKPGRNQYAYRPWDVIPPKAGHFVRDSGQNRKVQAMFCTSDFRHRLIVGKFRKK